MKKQSILILPLISGMLSCRPQAPAIYIGGYNFKFGAKTFRIESVTPNFRDGYNLLLLKDGDELHLMATDREQDGVLDLVNMGETPLEEAKEIYAEGIRFGHRKGLIKDRILTREYATSSGINNYVLQTFLLSDGAVYNKLFMRDISRKESILIDDGADGILDRIEQGGNEMGYYQGHYKIVLTRGINARQIGLTEGRYLVEK